MKRMMAVVAALVAAVTVARGQSTVSSYAVPQLVAEINTALANPQVTTVELGHATDTTLTRASAGVVAVEGKNVYVVGGTDVAVTDGGTGVSRGESQGVARGNVEVGPALPQPPVAAAAPVVQPAPAKPIVAATVARKASRKPATAGK
jgi:hypothetical protein